MDTLTVGPSSLHAELDDASNVLLAVPEGGAVADAGCVELSTVTPPGKSSVLYITVAGSPDDRLMVWRRHVDEGPARAAFVDVGDACRSAAAAADGAPSATPQGVRTVDDPGDLTALGIAVDDQLAAWEGDGRIVVCFHSLADLLDHVPVREVYRFLAVLTEQLAAVGATAHFHLDPDAVDEETLNVLRTRFDCLVAPAEDGWTISRE